MGDSKREIKRIISVLGAGVVFALMLTLFLIYNYGPSGRYNLYTVLLEPDILMQLNYNDKNPVTGGQDRYVFDRLEYNDPMNRIMGQTINLTDYEKFYQTIKSDKSLNAPVDPELEGLFRQPPPATIYVYVRTESPAAWQKNAKIFQDIQIANQGDYYRVELHEMKEGEHFAYFHHPKILEMLRQIVKP